MSRRALIVGLIAYFAISFFIIGTVAAKAAETDVCPDLSTGLIEVDGEVTEITVTAPEGMLIDGACIKAGSAKQGDGPITWMVDEGGFVTVTISHPSGKAISHYSLSYRKVPPSTTLPPTTTTTTSTTVPPTTSTTTTQPPGTTTTVSPTSTTVPPSTTTVPPVCDGRTCLPRTGFNLWQAAIAGLGMLSLGGLTLWRSRQIAGR